jgi:hypothetical protein
MVRYVEVQINEWPNSLVTQFLYMFQPGWFVARHVGT